MRQVLPSTLLIAMLFIAALGCSKKKDATPTSGTPEPVNPGPRQPGPTPPGGKNESPKSDADAVLAKLKDPAAHRDYASHEATIKQLRETIPPTHPRRGDVFRALVELRNAERDYHRRLSLDGLLPSYANGDDIPELVALVNKDPANDTLYGAAIRRLTELKDPRCVPDVLKWFAFRSPTRKPDAQARDLLKAIGPPAQSAVLAYTKPELEPGKPLPGDTRLGAVTILQEIGTEESVPALKLLLSDQGPTLRAAAQAAINAIQQRATKAKS